MSRRPAFNAQRALSREPAYLLARLADAEVALKDSLSGFHPTATLVADRCCGVGLDPVLCQIHAWFERLHPLLATYARMAAISGVGPDPTTRYFCCFGPGGHQWAYQSLPTCGVTSSIRSRWMIGPPSFHWPDGEYQPLPSRFVPFDASRHLPDFGAITTATPSALATAASNSAPISSITLAPGVFIPSRTARRPFGSRRCRLGEMPASGTDSALPTLRPAIRRPRALTLCQVGASIYEL